MARNVTIAARSFLGAFTAFCGFALMWVGATRDAGNREEVNQAFLQAVEIDAASPDPSNNGRIVIASGNLGGSGPVGDDFVKPGDYVILKRNVEMLQWRESFPRGSAEPEYRIEWVPGQVNFFGFQQPQGHENPLLTVTPETFVVPSPRFSGFDGSRIVASMAPQEILELAPEVLAKSGQEIAENRIILRRNPGGVAFGIGDIRVWYTVVRPGPYTIMAVQADERTLFGGKVDNNTIILPGSLSKEEFLQESVGEDAGWGNYSIMIVGASLLFVGLCSILARYKSTLDLRPKLNVKGPAAAAVLALGISLVSLFVFFVLALLG